MTSLAELREVDADPVTAAIYADIRACCALPQVNLIYRHLATLPGALTAVWHAVRPWMQSAVADNAVAALLAPVPGPVGLTAAELDGVDQSDLLDLLGVYGRGNVLNLLALSAIRRRLDDPALPPGVSPPQRPVSPAIPAIPPLPRLDGLSPAAAQAVAALAALHEAARHGVTPSLYLHLAHWPGLLPAVQRHVSAFVRQGRLVSERASVLATAAGFGVTTAPGLIVSLPDPIRDRAQAAITLFTGSVIPDLVVVGRMLTSAVQGGRQQHLPDPGPVPGPAASRS